MIGCSNLRVCLFLLLVLIVTCLLIVCSCFLEVLELLVAECSKIVIGHIYFLPSLFLQSLDKFINFFECTLKIKLLDIDKSQPKANFLSLCLFLFRKQKPLLSIGQHLLFLKQDSNIIDGYEGVRLQYECLFIAIDGEQMLFLS